MNIASSNSESFTSSDLKRIEYALGETNTPNHLIKQVQRIFSVFRPNASELDREMAVVSFICLLHVQFDGKIRSMLYHLLSSDDN